MLINSDILYDKIVATNLEAYQQVTTLFATDPEINTEDIQAINTKNAEMLLFDGVNEPMANGPVDEMMPDDLMAIIPIMGMMQRYASPYYISTSTVQVRELIKNANEFPNVHSIALIINSGGGTVNGTYELAEAIKSSVKPVIAIIEDRCGSAAYWAASQCDEIVVTSPTAAVGSIGAMTVHEDLSKNYEMRGYKKTYITSDGSELKVSGNEAEPLSSEALRLIKMQLNPINNIFHAAVKEGRADRLKDTENPFTAVMFPAKTAKSMGLIDGITTIEKALDTGHKLGRKYRKNQASAEREARKNKASTTLNNNSNMKSNWFEQKAGTAAKYTEPVVLSPETANGFRSEYAKLESTVESLEKQLQDAKAAVKEEAAAPAPKEEVKSEMQILLEKLNSLTEEIAELKEAKVEAPAVVEEPTEEVVEEEEAPVVVADEKNDRIDRIEALLEKVLLNNVAAPAVEVIEEVEEVVAEAAEVTEEQVEEVVAEEAPVAAAADEAAAAILARLEGLEEALANVQNENTALKENNEKLENIAKANRRRPTVAAKTVTTEVLEEQEKEEVSKRRGGRRDRSFYEGQKLSTATMIKK